MIFQPLDDGISTRLKHWVITPSFSSHVCCFTSAVASSMIPLLHLFDHVDIWPFIPIIGIRDFYLFSLSNHVVIVLSVTRVILS